MLWAVIWLEILGPVIHVDIMLLCYAYYVFMYNFIYLFIYIWKFGNHDQPFCVYHKQLDYTR